MNDEPIGELLEAFEQLLEHAKRESLVITQLITAMKKGERLSEGALLDYEQQIANASKSHAELAAMIARFWSQIGQSGPSSLH